MPQPATDACRLVLQDGDDSIGIDKLKESFVDLGEQSLKNIARSVRVYRFDLASKATTAPEAPPSLPAQSDKPSIAILAFTNMSGDPEQEYFSDGISEDIITDLSKLSELHVIARNSTFTYKGKARQRRTLPYKNPADFEVRVEGMRAQAARASEILPRWP